MRFSIGLALGVLLTGLSVACSSTYPIAEANPESPLHISNVAVKMKASPLRPVWRIGPPSSHGNLTVFPVLSDEPASAEGFITLDEGLRSGKVIITELGADGRSRRINPRQRMSDSAEVNKLALTNKSGKTLILIAGEVIIGGKQDRIVGHDCLVTSTNTPVPIDVFCVEHGRWQERPAFGQSQDTGSGSGIGSGTGSGAGAGSGLGAGSGSGSGGGSFSAPAAVIALPKVREKAQAKKDQSAVWADVAETVTVNAAESPTGTLNRVYEDKSVNSKLGSYERALKGKLTAKNTVGAVVAVGGTIITADVFASPSLFQAYWPKLLKSYALQAISTRITQQKEVTASEAESFLARVEGTKSSEGQEGVYRLTEHQSSTDASFELEHDANKPALIHFNRVNKK